MIKKNILLFVILNILCCVAVNAQTQQGFVKTPTRRNADGSWRKGEYIQGATVGIQFANKGQQTHVSGSDGHFSFDMSYPQFSVSSVTAKKGTYTFVDADFSKKQRSYSKNPLEVLVDDPNVLAKVHEESINKERAKLRKQIRAKEDEIEELKTANKITTEECNRMLDQLDQYRKSSEEIVRQIAEVYVTTDYDNLSDFNRQLLQYIEDGDYHRVDSLLKTKGNREDIYADIIRRKEAIRETRENLKKAEAYDAIDTKDFAQRLYYEHINFLHQPMMQDSALHCLRLRADLDTTNVEAVWDYAELARKQKKFANTEMYYKVCQRLCQEYNDTVHLATALHSLGLVYYEYGKFDIAEEYYKIALHYQEKLYTVNPDKYRANLAHTLSALGLLYSTLHDHANSEKYHKSALEFKEQLFYQNPDAYRFDLACTQNHLGILFHQLNDYANSEKYYKLALENFEHLFNQNPDAYRPDLAHTQNGLGLLSSALHDYANSEKYYKLALENFEHLFNQNPDAYRPDLARTQNNLGDVYSNINDFINSEKYYKLALENIEHLFNQYPDVYRIDLARTQNGLGLLCSALHDYVNSEKYYKLTLENIEQLFLKNPSAYREPLASTQYCLGSLYKVLQDYDNCEKYFKLSLDNIEMLFNENPDVLRSVLTNIQIVLGALYNDIHDYENSKKFYTLAYENIEQLFKQNPDTYRNYRANTCWDIMLLYAEIEDMEQYDIYLGKTLELYTELYSLQPDIYVNDVIDLQNRTIWRMLVKGSADNAMILAKETYSLDYSNETSKYYLAECYNVKAYEYVKLLDYTNAIKSINESITLVPTNANFYDTKGEILLMQGKDKEALEMWGKILELNPKFLDDYPNGTNLSNGLKEKALIE